MSLGDAFKAAAEWLRENTAPATEAPAVIVETNGRGGAITAVKDGYTLSFLKGPSINARRHVFADLGSFAAFLNRNAAPTGTDVLIDEREASADFRPGETSSSVVTCAMTLHPRFRRWKDACSKPLTQRQFLLLVTAARADFAEVKGGAGVSEGDVIASNLMRMSVSKSESYTSEVDERGTIRFRAGEGKVDLGGQVPGRFTVHVPVFLGIQAPDGTEPTYALEVLVQLDVEGAPAFTLAAPAVDLVVLEALTGARAFLGSKLDPGFLVGAGRRVVAEVPQRLATT